MKRIKSRSLSTVVSSMKSKSNTKVDVSNEYIPPLDVLGVKVLGLKVTDEVCLDYSVKVKFFDQLLINSVIKSTGTRNPICNRAQARGTMEFDPSDYEKMCLMANCPLIVHIQPIEPVDSNLSISTTTATESEKSGSSIKRFTDLSCCNIDILPLFIDKNKITCDRRMEPYILPTLLHRKSWDNLPLMTIEVSMFRNKLNAYHHKLLKESNIITLTLIAAYNMYIPLGDHIFTAASKSPLHNEMNTEVITFNQAHRLPNRFKQFNFNLKWESLRDNLFTKADEKFVCDLQSIKNAEDLDLKHYVNKNRNNTIFWGSFHRSLIIGNKEAWLMNHLRRYSWPFEVHLYEENGGLSFMAFLNLFHLLYPGEHTVRMAVPLQWVNSAAMAEKCNCELLLTPNLVTSTTGIPWPKLSSDVTPSLSTSVSGLPRPTGNDGNSAFIVVEIKMARPLKKAVISPIIKSAEINEMLQELEQTNTKRRCSGRGQLDRDWHSTVRSAELALRKVPHYGMKEFCAFNRQLSEARIRVELITSFWLDASVYINNNFVVQEFLQTEQLYEEMLLMSHACLVKAACQTLTGSDARHDGDPTLRAARHARQMQDIPHAVELYLQVVVQSPRCPDSWRELSTCLREVDVDWSNVCLNKSVALDPRHFLTLLCKGCMLFDEDPAAAEPFFVAIMSLYPFWTTGWVIANAYYHSQQLYHMADEIMKIVRRCEADGYAEDLSYARSWGHELGDWWDQPPLLPGMSPYYRAADLLLRLRALSLADACLSRAIMESGETAAAMHQIALSNRLRGDIEAALCHLQIGIDKFGDINYLRGLQAECYHKQKDIPSSMASYEKAGSCLSAYSILLSLSTWEPKRARCILLDLLRRQPSAYAWVALAEDWIHRATSGEAGDAGAPEVQTGTKICAAASAVQAIKWDRQASRAWALLSQLVAPSAKRAYCRKMAQACGYEFSDGRMESARASQQSLCHRLGRALRECRCMMCNNLAF